KPQYLCGVSGSVEMESQGILLLIIDDFLYYRADEDTFCFISYLRIFYDIIYGLHLFEKTFLCVRGGRSFLELSELFFKAFPFLQEPFLILFVFLQGIHTSFIGHLNALLP